jgi:hypothetical protein
MKPFLELAGFYGDDEVTLSDSASVIPSDPRLPIDFRGDEYGRLPDSFRAETFSPSVEHASSYSLGSAPSSYTHPDLGRSFAGDCFDADGDDPHGTIESEQVRVFWRQYNAYPTYLKNLKKRNRKKVRKAKQARPDGQLPK